MDSLTTCPGGLGGQSWWAVLTPGVADTYGGALDPRWGDAHGFYGFPPGQLWAHCDSQSQLSHLTWDAGVGGGHSSFPLLLLTHER